MRNSEPGGLSGEHLAPAAEGRYQVDEHDPASLLGRGGQGLVWKAFDTVLRRHVALKKLHADALSDPTTVSAFLREARLTALLDHPGIVPIHDVGRSPADGSVYIALGLIGGTSLHARLETTTSLNERLALVPSLLRACQAVAFAHARGVVHRDLKPQNIMLGPFGETYVLDWGLALLDEKRSAADITAPHHVAGVVGTPAYMSPEQALGLAADSRSDVWGLGACLYQLLTGEPPITGRSLQSAVGHASRAEVPPVIALEPEVPTDLAAICQKAIEQERDARYPDAGAMAADLEAWLAGRTVSARTYGRGELLKRALIANRRAIGLLLLALGVLSTVLTLDELRVRAERNEARSFVRELIVDLPQLVESSRANIELINALTERTLRWLGRDNLSDEEVVEACGVFDRLASLNLDSRSPAKARALGARAIRVGDEASERSPTDPRFFACRIDSRATLAYVEHEAGDAARSQALFEEGIALAEQWGGARTSGVQLAFAGLLVKKGFSVWGSEPVAARQHFIRAAALADPFFDDPVPEVRHEAVRASINGMTGLWGSGRVHEAMVLGRRIAAAVAADCHTPILEAQRRCSMGLGSWVALALHHGETSAKGLSEQLIAADDFVFERDVDSSATIHDSMIMRIELGEFESASQRARALRLHGESNWGANLGPLAALLAGDETELEAWRPLVADATTGAPLSFALNDVVHGRYTAAADGLARVNRHLLWNDLSWPARGVPSITVPAIARPAFDRFWATFTRAYAFADEPAMNAALAAFEAELRTLADAGVAPHGAK